MSAALQSLSRHELGEDLSQRVLQLAERRMLTEPSSVDQRPTPEGFSWWSIPRRMLTRRNLVWLGLTVSVAVVLMLTDPSRGPETGSRFGGHSPRMPNWTRHGSRRKKHRRCAATRSRRSQG